MPNLFWNWFTYTWRWLKGHLCRRLRSTQFYIKSIESNWNENGKRIESNRNESISNQLFISKITQVFPIQYYFWFFFFSFSVTNERNSGWSELMAKCDRSFRFFICTWTAFELIFTWTYIWVPKKHDKGKKDGSRKPNPWFV